MRTPCPGAKVIGPRSAVFAVAIIDRRSQHGPPAWDQPWKRPWKWVKGEKDAPSDEPPRASDSGPRAGQHQPQRGTGAAAALAQGARFARVHGARLAFVVALAALRSLVGCPERSAGRAALVP